MGRNSPQQAEPLCHQLNGEKIDAIEFAARPVQARDKTKFDRSSRTMRTIGIAALAALAANVDVIARGDDDLDLSSNEFSCQHRQSIVLTLGPAILHCHVLVFNIARVGQRPGNAAER